MLRKHFTVKRTEVYRCSWKHFIKYSYSYDEFQHWIERWDTLTCTRIECEWISVFFSCFSCCSRYFWDIALLSFTFGCCSCISLWKPSCISNSLWSKGYIVCFVYRPFAYDMLFLFLLIIILVFLLTHDRRYITHAYFSHIRTSQCVCCICIVMLCVFLAFIHSTFNGSRLQYMLKCSAIHILVCRLLCESVCSSQ